MSSHDRQFVLFGELAPDTIEFDNPTLEVARNVTPSYGAYRPVEEAEIVASVQDENPATGGYCHLSSVGAPHMRVQPMEGAATQPLVGNWYTRDMVLVDDSEVEDQGAEALRGFLADDTNYIRSVPINAPDTLPEIRYKLETPLRVPTYADVGDVYIRIRARFIGDADRDFTGHEFNVVLYDNTTTTEVCSTTFTYTKEDGEFESFSYELDATDLGNLAADWSDLELRIDCDSTAGGTEVIPFKVPIKDEQNLGWKDSDGGESDLFEAIAELTDDTKTGTKYIVSPSIRPKDNSAVVFKMETPELPPDPEDGSYEVYASFWADKPNMTVKAQWIQPASPDDEAPDDDEPDDGFTTISDVRFVVLHEESVDNVSIDDSAPTVLSGDMSTSDAYQWGQNFEPGKSVYVAFTATYGGGTAEGELSHIVPRALKKSGGLSGTYADVDNCVDGLESQADTGTKINVPAPGFESFTVTMIDGPANTKSGGHFIKFLASGAAGQEVVVKLQKLDEASGVYLDVHVERPNLTASNKWHTITIPSAKIKQYFGGDYTAVRIQFSGTFTNGSAQFYEIFFSYPGDSNKAYVVDTYVNSGRGLHGEISLASVDSKNPKNENLGDRNEIYIGTNSSIYEIENGGFTDVSRSVAPYGGDAYGLGALDDIPKLWSWTSFGDDIVATNYADEPQYRTFGEAQFKDLYDTGAGNEEPYGRHVAVIGAQLVFADINPTSYASGKPFHLWCSRPMVPQYFEPADLDNLSALFALVAKPGAITGLIGGEYGTVFKRNSIWRMTFVGLPIIYNFDLVADGLGCSHPQSIVKAGSDIYFWDSGGIFVLAGGQQPQRISGGRIEKAIFDSKFESHSLKAEYGIDARENEATVWGAYDAYSGLVWWLYRTANTSQFALDHMIVYSTVEGRFSTIKIDSMAATMILGRQNVWSNEPVLNRGLLMFNTRTDTGSNVWIDNTKFIGEHTNRAKLKSKIITPASWGYQVGRDAELYSVRAMYKANEETTALKTSGEPNFTIKVESAQDPSFQNGYQSTVVDRSREGRDGWIPIKPQSGEFWRFTVNVPKLFRTTVKEFLGVQLKTRQAGDF